LHYIAYVLSEEATKEKIEVDQARSLGKYFLVVQGVGLKTYWIFFFWVDWLEFFFSQNKIINKQLTTKNPLKNIKIIFTFMS
jgi:hypothetical protein